MNKILKILIFTLCALFLAASANAAYTITRVSAPDFYIDTGSTPLPNSMYAGYRITSSTDVTDAWVTIGNFTGGVVSLAANETGIIHIGPMTSGTPYMAYFYLTATGATAVSQGHTISVYDAYPAGPAFSQGFTLTSVQDTIKANANVVNALVAGPNPATLGGIMTITVTGDTGVIGSVSPLVNGPLVWTPAAFADWRADAYQLVSVVITLSNGNTGTYYDTLYIAGLTNSATTHYEAVYTFRAISVTTAPTSVSPVGYIASGTQIKHTTLTAGAYAGAGLLPIDPATNSLIMYKYVNITSLPNTGGVVQYTLRLNNSSSLYPAYVDKIVDTLPSLPANATYVASSSAYDGASITEPVISGQTLTWYKLFSVPAGATKDLTFNVTLPATSGTYSNSAIAYVGQSTVIDTSISTTNLAPAFADTVVLAAPTMTKAFSPNSIAPAGVTTLTFTITNPSSTVALSGVAFADTFPVAPGAMTLSSPVTANTCGGSITEVGGGPLVAGSASIKLSGGAIAVGGSCAITVQVTASVPGTYNNTSGAVSSTNTGTGLTASASVFVTNKPGITKSFAPSSIAVNGTSTVTFTIANNTNAITGVSFTDTFPITPGAMTVAAPLTTSSTCGGTLLNNLGGALAAGSAGIRLTGGSIAANGACTVTVNVTAPVRGSYTNTSGGVSSTETGAAGSASNGAILSVYDPPIIAKTFSPALIAIAMNSDSTLTVTLTNPNTLGSLTGVGFVDIFPVSPGPVTLFSTATTNTCGGALTDNAGVALTTGSASIKLVGGTIAAGSSCSVTVKVKGTTAGTHVNTTGAVTSNEGGIGATATANLVLDNSPYFTKSFSPATIISRGTSVLTFSIKNNLAGALTGITFTDTFPTLPSQMSLSVAATTNTCGGTLTDHLGAALAVGSKGIKLTGGSIATAGATCTITATVTAVSGGLYTNTTTTIASNAPTGREASATLNVYTLAKKFNPGQILPTGAATLMLIVANLDPVNAISGITFSDIFPTTPAQMSLSSAAASNTCGGALTDNAGGALAVGSTSVKITNGTLAANGICMVQVTVKANTATVGSYANTAGVNSTDTLVLSYSPTIAKSFAPASIAPGGTSVMTLTLTNNTAIAGALTNVSFTDTFPTGLVVAATPALTNTCGGTISGGTTGVAFLNLSGGTIATGAATTCAISVTVTAASSGTYLNTASGVSTSQTGTVGPVSNTASLVVSMTMPGVTKSFSPASIGLNDSAVMTFAFTNPNATNITGLTFTDVYPAGMMNAASGTVVASNTCGGTVSAANSGTSFAINSAFIPPAGCSITVNVVGSAVGDKLNSTGVVSATNAVSNPGVTATLSVLNKLVVTKAFVPSTTSIVTTSVLTLTLNNTNAVAITGVDFSDIYPVNLTNTALPGASTTCAGGTLTAPASGGYVSYTGGTVPAATTCTVTVNLGSTVAGAYLNSTGTINTTNAGSTAAATATLTVTNLPSLLVMKTVSTAYDPISLTVNPKAIPGAEMLYTISVTNTGLGSAQSVIITDQIPANTSIVVNDISGAGSGPVLFTDGAGALASGLGYSFAGLGNGADNLFFANDSPPTYAYTAVNTGGVDANVTYIKITFTGSMNGASGGNNPTFTVKFKVRIN